MKKLLVFLIIIATVGQGAKAQALLVFDYPDSDRDKNWNYQPRRIAAPAATQFVAGMAKGVGDMLQFKYSRTIFPQQPGQRLLGRSRQYYDPARSWRNKYQNGDPRQGEKFPLSASMFVGLTDAWHATDFVRTTAHQMTVFTYRYPSPDRYRGKNRGWKTFLIDFAIMKLAHSTGFHIAQKAVQR